MDNPIAGLFDFVALATNPGVRDYARELLGGDLEELSETWIEASPVTWVDGSEPPFLLIHGTRDLSIPTGHSEDFAQVLETASIDVDILLVPDLNHSQIVGHGSSLSVVEAFLERILTGR